jgi:hypothetical protein
MPLSRKPEGLHPIPKYVRESSTPALTSHI